MTDLGDVLRLPGQPVSFVCKRCGALVAELLRVTHADWHLAHDLGTPLWGAESAPDSAAPGSEPSGP
jgi:Ubiquitin-Binding Zinc Finger